ncbi:YihY/virulence factor BrkB family protein [Pradoshia eiseniae]|uniref:YihY/virulence factor BrkB family protein n=1 Tax=Pradoshia eiseniae TaxID=2064768 RepID=UPI001F1C64BC|nr:YihY/virulence factor BrkB family protein [Pradoshia eiseniae]
MAKVVTDVGRYKKKTILKHLYEKIKEDEITGLAAQLAYYFLLSIFPLLIFTITLLPYFPVTTQDIISMLEAYVPSESVKLLESSLSTVMENRNGGLLSFGILATIWSASNGINAIIRALNHAYDVEESRSFIVSRALALVLTVAMIIVVVISLLLPIFGKMILGIVFDFLGFEPSFMYTLLRWTISIAVTTFVFTMLYWLGPDVKLPIKWAWPGALFSSIGWALSSLAFSFYVNSFANFSSTYGSLGGLIVLMLWFYISGLVIIVGGEINAVLRHNRTIK